MESSEINVNYDHDDLASYRHRGVKSITILNNDGHEVTISLGVLKEAFTGGGVGPCTTFERDPLKFPPCFTSKCPQCRFKQYCSNAKV